ncbi:MAG: glycosyltransferase family 4 protein [Phycisphaeraceae bacterium]|nr:glycosyltransferase family 4 protein [Phycisphaeraceae bacterium]
MPTRTQDIARTNQTSAGPSAGADPAARPLRFMLQQSAMPKFRVPCYRELSNRPGVQLKVLYGKMALPNVDAPDLDAEFREMRVVYKNFMWDSVFLRKLQPGALDATTVAWNTRFLSLIPSLLKARRAGIGTVLWGHGYSKREAPHRKWIRRKVVGLADAIALYSESVAQQYIDSGVAPERVFVALNSLDQAPIQAARQPYIEDPSRIAAFRREQNLGDAPVVLFVSRTYPENRVDLLLRAVAALTAEFPTSTAVIIGAGPEDERLRELAATLNLGDRARFLGAIYEEERIAPWFMAADCFCYPQNIGLSILHAMGYGLPVVTSDRIETQNPEIEALEHERNGLTYTHGSLDALVEALRRLFTDKPLRERLSAHAHQTATQKYSITRMADGLENALRFAAERARERRAKR